MEARELKQVVAEAALDAATEAAIGRLAKHNLTATVSFRERLSATLRVRDEANRSAGPRYFVVRVSESL